MTPRNPNMSSKFVYDVIYVRNDVIGIIYDVIGVKQIQIKFKRVYFPLSYSIHRDWQINYATQHGTQQTPSPHQGNLHQHISPQVNGLNGQVTLCSGDHECICTIHQIYAAIFTLWAWLISFCMLCVVTAVECTVYMVFGSDCLCGVLDVVCTRIALGKLLDWFSWNLA